MRITTTTKITIQTTTKTAMKTTLFILRAERTLRRLPPVAHRNLRSPRCSTLVFHSTRIERQRTLAVDSLDYGVPQVIVCKESTQKKGETTIDASMKTATKTNTNTTTKIDKKAIP